jgi:hypothetical protein
MRANVGIGKTRRRNLGNGWFWGAGCEVAGRLLGFWSGKRESWEELRCVLAGLGRFGRWWRLWCV